MTGPALSPSALLQPALLTGKAGRERFACTGVLELCFCLHVDRSQNSRQLAKENIFNF